MFVGQIQVAPYTGNMGVSAARAHSPFASMQTSPARYDRVEVGTCSQVTEHSAPLLHISRPTVSRRRKAAMKRLRELMEDST